MEPVLAPEAQLEQAIRKWNAIATASFPDLTDSLREAQTSLGDLLRAIEERRVLSQAIAGNHPQEAGAFLEELPEALATFHIELRALSIQANRALQTGEEVAAILSELTHRPHGLSLMSVAEIGDAPPSEEREAKLMQRVTDLELEVEHLRSDAIRSEGFPAPAPTAMQDELARLRQEVEELKVDSEKQAEAATPPDSRIQDEAFDDAGKRRPMGLILLKAGLISTEQLEMALSHQRSAWNRHLGAILVELGFVEDEAVARAIAAQTRVDFVRLSDHRPQMDALKLVSRKLADHHTLIPVRTHFNEIIVAMANPLDLVALEDVKLATGRPVQPVVATARDIGAAISRLYGNRA